MPRPSSVWRQGRLWRGVLLSLLVVALLGCGSENRSESQAKSEKTEEQSVRDKGEVSDPNSVRHELKVRWIDINASYVITINGFPALQEYVQARSVDNEFDVQLNTGLVGEGNKVEIRLEPLLTRSGKGLSIGTIELGAEVLGPGRSPIVGAKITEAQADSVYQDWSEQARTKWKEYRSRAEKGALDSIRAWAERNPLTVRATFDNETGPDFSRIFEEAPKLKDTPATRERLKSYAMRLRELFAKRDTLAIYQEHRPSFEEGDVSKEKALQAIGTGLLKSDWHLDFSPEDLAVRRWSSGRVWEIYRDDRLSDQLKKEALLLAGEERLATWHRVYVAELDGELRVVRSSF